MTEIVANDQKRESVILLRRIGSSTPRDTDKKGERSTPAIDLRHDMTLFQRQ